MNPDSEENIIGLKEIAMVKKNNRGEPKIKHKRSNYKFSTKNSTPGKNEASNIRKMCYKKRNYEIMLLKRIS